jgi:hypothetical protein
MERKHKRLSESRDVWQVLRSSMERHTENLFPGEERGALDQNPWHAYPPESQTAKESVLVNTMPCPAMAPPYSMGCIPTPPGVTSAGEAEACSRSWQDCSGSWGKWTPVAGALAGAGFVDACLFARWLTTWTELWTSSVVHPVRARQDSSFRGREGSIKDMSALTRIFSVMRSFAPGQLLISGSFKWWLCGCRKLTVEAHGSDD